MDGNIAGGLSVSAAAVDLTEKELLKAILEENKKRTFYSKIAAVAGVLFLMAAVVCLVVLVPRINSLVGNAQLMVNAAVVTLAEAENAASELSVMSENIIQTSNEVNRFVTDNSGVIADTMADIGKIDYEGLNKAIKDLQAAVEPFAKFMSRFK